MKINTALILCAGYGKRLNPLTLVEPKPLLKINEITYSFVSKCGSWDKMISGYDTIIDFDVEIDIWDFANFCQMLVSNV